MVVVEVVAGTADVARALSAGAIAVGMRVVLFRRVGVRPARVHARLAVLDHALHELARRGRRLPPVASEERKLPRRWEASVDVPVLDGTSLAVGL